MKTVNGSETCFVSGKLMAGMVMPNQTNGSRERKRKK